MAALRAHQLALRDLRLKQQRVQFLQESLVALQLLGAGRLVRELREAQLL